MLPIMPLSPHAERIPGYFEEKCTTKLNGIFLISLHISLKLAWSTLPVANLQVGPGDLPVLQLLSRQ